MNAAKARLTQTFKFLKELNDLRNPVPRDLSSYGKLFWIDDWPIHPLIEVQRGDRSEEDDESNDAEMEPLIRIRRANLTPCPKPPEMLDDWLKPGWQSVEAEPDVLTSRNSEDKERGSTTIAFEEDQQRVAALSEWTRARSKWVAAERPAVAARKLFEEIHALWTSFSEKVNEQSWC
ncbi:MAG: hypothetical protein WAM05_09750 [Candidatus Binataceae bacterium]